MQECKVFDEITETFEKDVEITGDSQASTLNFRGTRAAVAKAKSFVSDMKVVRSIILFYRNCIYEK